MQATRDMLLETGYSRLTMEGVAARSGTGKATIYRWWSTKGELVLEAAGDDIAIGSVPDTGTTRTDIETAVDQLITTFSKPLAAIVIFAAITTLDDDPKMALIFRDNFVYPWRVSAAAAIQRGIDRGDISLATDIHFLLDVVVGTVFQRTLVVREPQTEDLSRKIMDLLLPAH